MINKIALLLFFALISGCTSEKQNDPETEARQDFRLIAYNVWYGFTEVPERKTQWIQWMQNQEPDVVSLQELNEYTPEKLAEDAALWGHPYSELLKEDGFPTGVTSKYPIEDIHRFIEGFHHGLLRVKIEGMYFYIIHLHPSNWEVRNREIDFILSDIQKLPPDSRVILAGDFNTFSPDDSIYYSHGRLEPFFNERDEAYNEVNLREGMLDYSVIQKLKDRDLVDLEVNMRPSEYAFTGSFPTLIEKEGEHGDQRRLDYVFVDPVLAGQVKQAYIVADDTTLTLSDHLPVMVDFSLPATVTAQDGELTLDDLFATPKLTGTTPSQPAWAPNSEHFAFSWSEPGTPGRGLWVSTSDGKDVRLISNTASAPVSDIVWTDATTIVSLRGNHLWQTSLSQGDDVQFMSVEAGAHTLSISPGGNQAAYIRNGDLWLADFASKQNRQLTEIGIASLSSVEKGRYSRPEREIGPGIWSGPTYKWAPDGKTIALHVVDRREMRKVPFPDYLATETNPNEVRRGYPGDPNEIRRVGVLDVQSGAITYLDLPDPDANQVIDFNWSPGGALLVDTASDTAFERKLFVVAPGESQLREIWRGVRESRMYTSFGSTWHPDGEHVVFLSDMGDRYGLYTIDASPSRDRTQLLTDPSYDVLSAPTIAGDALFYAGNGVNPYEQHVYRLHLSGGAPEQVTRLAGRNAGYPSPDGRHLAFMHSNDTSPTELYVVSSEGGDATRVTHSPLPAFTERTWAAAEYVRFPSLVDDYTLHARILKPANMQPGMKYPVLFGPVYSNTAKNRWAGNYSLVQQLLVKKGYIVVQVDSRGSDGYGRAFREEFLLGFADQDIEDYASAVAYMESLAYVDPDRIGIWGSSYGGTLSVYSLLMKPGLFQVGVAAAAAVDPAFFGTDDVAIVRRPQTHPEIFERKALNYAANLEDKLLFIHGIQDHVVPFKTTAVLAEELIKQGKDFDFAFAPGATHGWSREQHYDRYLFGKMIEYFDRHLAVPSE